MDSIGGPCVRVEKKRSFPLVHVAEGKLPGSDGLHDAYDHGGARTKLIDRIFCFRVGKVVVIAEELTDKSPGGNAPAGEALWVDIPVL